VRRDESIKEFSQERQQIQKNAGEEAPPTVKKVSTSSFEAEKKKKSWATYIYGD